jgi:hypothetical protein
MDGNERLVIVCVQARDEDVEGIVLTVNEGENGLLHFVSGGGLNLHATLCLEDAIKLLETIIQEAHVAPQDSGVSEGLLVLHFGVQRQCWRVYVLPDSQKTEVLLRFMRSDLEEALAMIGLPRVPSYETLSAAKIEVA